MSKKYLNLDEAARMLSLAPEELVRMRERGDVRGFADRGTWKFKFEDIESLLRRRQADSSPELPLIDPHASVPESRSPRQDMGEQPTVIRRERAGDPDANLLSQEPGPSHLDSDSDVRLSGGGELELDFDVEGDSDIKLTGLQGVRQNTLGTDPEIVINKLGSDSDVRLVRSDSDSDVKLTADSDSDVKLTAKTDETDMQISLKAVDDDEGGTDHSMEQKKKSDANSDSDVKLVPNDSGIVGDVSLMDDDDDAIAIDFDPDHSRHASVLDDEPAISLGRDSSLLLGESGISLAGPSDSGINLQLNDDDAGLTLAIDDESGISLDAGESGISLESAESGISLESAESGISLDDGDHSGTMPMIDIFADDNTGDTHFEVESLADDDSNFDMLGGATSEMETLEDSVSDEVFDLDDDSAGVADFGDEMDLDEEPMDGDLDVFDADEGAFEEAGGEAFAGAPVGRMRPAETEWETSTFIGLTLGSLLLLLCGVVMVDLVKNTATAATPNPVTGQILEMIGGLYK